MGESGSGKTTLALGAIGYLPANGRVESGMSHLAGIDLAGRTRRQLRHVWGSKIGLVSQNPQAALNPTLTIGQQLDEMGRRHLDLGRRGARAASLAMLERVAMPDSQAVVSRYPHQLSGGMLQRCAIAMALLTHPDLLIMDEPTTGLDVTTQATILDLLEDLKAEFRTAILYITHNLGVVSRICDRIAVMYAGEIFEEASAIDLFARPLHPYTANLLHCVPRLGGASPGTVDRDGWRRSRARCPSWTICLQDAFSLPAAHLRQRTAGRRGRPWCGRTATVGRPVYDGGCCDRTKDGWRLFSLTRSRWHGPAGRAGCCRGRRRPLLPPSFPLRTWPRTSPDLEAGRRSRPSMARLSP